MRPCSSRSPGSPGPPSSFAGRRCPAPRRPSTACSLPRSCWCRGGVISSARVERRAPPRLDARSRRAYLLALGGGVFFGLDLALYNTAVMRTTATTATLFGNNSPIFVGIGTWMFFRRRPQPSVLDRPGARDRGCGNGHDCERHRRDRSGDGRSHRRAHVDRRGRRSSPPISSPPSTSAKRWTR